VPAGAMKLHRIGPSEEHTPESDLDLPETGPQCSRPMSMTMQWWSQPTGYKSWADVSEENDETNGFTSCNASESAEHTLSLTVESQGLETSGDLATVPLEASKKSKSHAKTKAKLRNRALKREELFSESLSTSMCSTSSDGASQHVGKFMISTSVSSASSESFCTATDGGSESELSSTSGKLDELSKELEEVRLLMRSNGVQDHEIEESQTSSQHGSDRELGDLPSEGSRGHATSTCKPCMFIHSAIGCYKGMSCSFCHFSHEGIRRPRPCKAKRERYRKLITASAQRQRETELEISPQGSTGSEMLALT